jgi:uncharacterized membrane protein YhhN
VTPVVFAAAAVAAVSAVVDWWAVARSNTRVEYVAKPLTMAALVVVAATLTPAEPDRQWLFVAAGVLSLAGDVFLMLPRDRFVPGLVSFLLAHVCYIVGLLQVPVTVPGAALGAAVVAVAIATIGVRVLRAVGAGEQRVLLAPVSVYLVVISAMVVAAFATGPLLAAAGALVFYTSDSLIAEHRFVQPRPWAPVAIMVTYHLGQAALVFSLPLS